MVSVVNVVNVVPAGKSSSGCKGAGDRKGCVEGTVVAARRCKLLTSTQH